MSLMRRNIIATLLLFIASVCLILVYQGPTILDSPLTSESTFSESIVETTFPETENETIAESFDIKPSNPGNYVTHTTPPPTEPGVVDSVPHTELYTEESSSDHPTPYQILFTVIGIVGLICFFSGTFLLWQKNPIFGPDGVGVFSFLLYFLFHILWEMDSPLLSLAGGMILAIFLSFFGLLFVRELWGWLRCRTSLSWCLIQRLVNRTKQSPFSLTLYVGWIAGSMVLCVLMPYMVKPILFPVLCLVFSAVLGFACLLQYGSDLNHFKKQLDHFQNGETITVKNGPFEQTEAQLLEVQSQHEEAIRQAVTSERFKVELISNVSHDLRTPLTSILGYSELLQKEALSPEAKKQVERLHLKAGYMNDLVESLFELTKVSSGVLETNLTEIDLIRLLEQTIGLFDDQLTSHQLVLRRHYEKESLPVVTDGARMHQVFANLLGNAIKYALPGTRLFVEVTESENHYRVRMINTASYEMDFKPEEILQRFARGDKARSTKGSGLGLAIAQTYTESVGGTFQIQIDGDQFNAIVTLPKL